MNENGTTNTTSEEKNTRLYIALEVTKDATPEEIRRSYKRLALKYHPDKNPSKNAVNKFREITEAYKILSDEHKRHLYDTHGDDWQHHENTTSITTRIFNLVGRVLEEVAYSPAVPFDTIAKQAKRNAVKDFTKPAPEANSLPAFSLGTVGFNLHRSLFTIYRKEGWKDLWRGNVISITTAVIYDQVREFVFTHTTNGLISAFTALALAYPLEVLGTCVRTKALTTSTWGNFSGLKTIYSLSGVTEIFGSLLLDSSRLTEWINKKVQEYEDQEQMKKAMSLRNLYAIGKRITLSLFTTPLKTLVIATQLQAVAATPMSFLQVCKSLMNWRSLSKLYAGLIPDLFYNATTVIIASLSY